MPSVDRVITTRELVWMIKNAGLDFHRLPQRISTQRWAYRPAQALSSALPAAASPKPFTRTAYWMMTGETLGGSGGPRTVRSVRGRCKTLDRPGSATGRSRSASHTALQRGIRLPAAGAKQAGGVPFYRDNGLPGRLHPAEVDSPTPAPERAYRWISRTCASGRRLLRSIDAGKTLKRSYENPDVVRVYKDYLGEPMSEKAHELLHTHYAPRLPLGVLEPGRPENGLIGRVVSRQCVSCQ